MERRAVVALGYLLCAPWQSAEAEERAPARAEAIEADLARAAQIRRLGDYEQQALELALAERGLDLEPAPTGKILRRVHVVNLPVFGAKDCLDLFYLRAVFFLHYVDGFCLAWFNRFHVTSRERMVAREVLVHPGERWDEERVDETQRRLRDPLFSTLAVVVPVRVEGEPAGQVDLLVVTRDVWSLRPNSRYEFQEGVLSELSLSVSENNLFGLRKQFALVFAMDLGAYAIGPLYVDKNIAGTHLTLTSQVDAVFNRNSHELEGSQSSTTFAYPLWSLDRTWGAAIDVSHFDAVRRSFLGAELRSFRTMQGVDLPWEYDERDLDIQSSVVRSKGHAVKHRLSFGHRLAVQRPRVRDDFAGDARDRAEFESQVLPRSERSSSVFGRYSLFTPVYTSYRNIDTFDLTEDQRLGPELEAEVGSAIQALGSEVAFLYGSLSAAWTFDLAGDGLARISADVSSRRQDGEFIDILRNASVKAASPPFLGMRLAARAAWSRRENETSNRFFSVGGDSGLRGYTIAAFVGGGPSSVRVLTNLELRTRAVPILFTRLGGLLFWDAGHAADCYRGCDNALLLHQDIGAGARLLIPQAQPYVLRFDWALPLTGPTAGLPGRFIAGVSQVF